MLSQESSLRKLPATLDHRQKLFFDGIRYSIEMADIAYSRLTENLKIHTNMILQSSNNDQSFASIFLDAWSIVDSIHRLSGLLREAPNIKQKSPVLRIFYQKIEGVQKLRNAVQHLNSEINKITDLGIPVWGSISYFALLEPESNTGYICSLIAGTLFVSKDHQLINPCGKEITSPIDLVTLSAFSHTFCITETIQATEQLLRSLEAEIKPQTEGYPVAGSDFSICLKVTGKN